MPGRRLDDRLRRGLRGYYPGSTILYDGDGLEGVEQQGWTKASRQELRFGCVGLFLLETLRLGLRAVEEYISSRFEGLNLTHLLVIRLLILSLGVGELLVRFIEHDVDVFEHS